MPAYRGTARAAPAARHPRLSGAYAAAMSDELRAAAQAAAAHAHAPYSDFAVGAAIAWADGIVTSGANVENASYPLSLCAERAAVAAGTSRGARALLAVAVWADVDGVVTPCGGCRQVLIEFATEPECVEVHLGGRAGWEVVTLAELLPRAFGS